MSVLQNDVEALQMLYASTLVDVITNLLTALVAVSILWYHDPVLTLEGLPVPILFGIVLALFGRPLHRVGREVRDRVQGVQEVLQESAAGAREVKAFGRGASELGRYVPRVRELVRARVRQAVLGAANWSIADLVAWTGMTGVLVLASIKVVHGHMQPGTAVLLLSTLGMLFGPAGAVSNIYNQVMSALGAADRVFEFQDAAPEVEAAAPRELAAVDGRVRFEHVTFRYDEEGGDVLEDIVLDVRPGEVIALVGPSGAGKSTLVSLIPRLYDPAAGRVLVDDVDVRDVSLASLRACIAMVPQEPFLFGTTVRENIAFGRESAGEEEIVEAAKAANAHEFIVQLPEGYETQVGERGVRLSVGQKQRLAVARALLRNPRILILDEATSAQDSESERLVQEAMRRLMEGRTSFVIAHRLSTVLRADRIVVLENGRITEIGKHADLLTRGGTYAHLYELQFTDGASTRDEHD